MQPVEGTSLISRADPIHQQVYNYIHQAITSGEFGPGQRLVEAQIAARLGISRAPVRVAIRKLEQDGLVVSVTGKGSVVQRFTLRDIREVYSCRGALEGLAVQLVAADPDPAFVKRLAELVERKRVATAARRTPEIEDQTKQLHTAQVQPAGNRLLAEIMHGLGERILFYRLLAIREVPISSEISQAAHEQLVEAIRRGDGAAGSAIVQQSFLRVYEHLAAYLKAHGLAEDV